jgi:hypothetical protein
MPHEPRKFGKGVGSEGILCLPSVKGLLLDGLTLELAFKAASTPQGIVFLKTLSLGGSGLEVNLRVDGC